ncbi:class A beta-lactamase-related serine hydrolase [Bacteroides sp. 214]|uniref:serine hydrolase domain-containing protein n=1 Tax=Bacteroides sp. 214 TaxID=2302935 RepID=UPI0013D19DDD|nr:serine hydrolase domain-containing protein [Bacteroides sp. 214]NDW12607.1 class A beta-lactamase-related serine hydrolase [Bacteroides sp. 214]
MKPLLITLFVTLMLTSCNKSKHEVALEKIDSLFTSLYPVNEPGAAVLILKDNNVLFSKGYGIADMDEQTPINEQTFFNIASVSKQFSAVAILMLAEEERLSLDDAVSKWFPEFTSPLLEKITLKHLLTHTSGIPDTRDRSDRDFVLYSTDVESYAYIGTLEQLNFEPGAYYEYMNPTYQLMYTIIERASGMQFDDFMQERIFKAAGMNESTYFEAGKEIPRMAHGYEFDKDTLRWEEYDYGEESFFASKADGGIYTSVNEFVLWEKALRNNILISAETTETAHAPQIIVTDSPYSTYQNRPYTSYGYGWFIEEKPGMPKKVYHTGDNGGFQIYAGRFPEKNLLYLFFANRSDRDRQQIAEQLDAIFQYASWI